MENEKTCVCESCVHWDSIEGDCEHPDVDASQHDLGVGFDFQTDTCETYKKQRSL